MTRDASVTRRFAPPEPRLTLSREGGLICHILLVEDRYMPVTLCADPKGYTVYVGWQAVDPAELGLSLHPHGRNWVYIDRDEARFRAWAEQYAHPYRVAHSLGLSLDEWRSLTGAA